MLTLKDISTYQYITNKNNIYRNKTEDKYIQLLINYEVYDFEKLYELIKNGNPDFQNAYFLEKIKDALSVIDIINKSVSKPIIYDFNEFLKYPEYEQLLNCTDANVLCRELPIKNPLYPSSLIVKLRDYDIKFVKNLLSKINIEGTNALTNSLRSVGAKTTEFIVQAIRFYEKQIIRIIKTSDDLHDFKGNLFYKDRDLKAAIVREQLEDIIIYLYLNGNNFVWGPISDSSREILLRSLCSNTNRHVNIRNEIANLIINYTTLEELEDNVIKSGTLNRFITEKR